MSTTTTHILRTSRGAYRLDVTETADTVYVAHRGVRLRSEDISRFVAWAWPILDVYRDDPRRFEMSGEHVDWTGRAEWIHGQWVSYRVPRGSAQ